MIFAPNGTEMAQKFVVHLGKWHPFKELASLVWKFFLPIHLADSFFALFPTSACYIKPKLTSILTMFAYHFNVYPYIRAALQEAINTTRNTPDRRELLLNLRDFYEIYVPTVSTLKFIILY